MSRNITSCKCIFCKKTFSHRDNPNNRKFCSLHCSGLNRRRGKIVKCVICHSEFYRRNSPSEVIKNSGKYCSRKCKGIGSRLKPVPCRFCGKLFKPKVTLHSKFCSSLCKHAARKNGRNIKCEHCGKEFYLAKGRLQKAKHFFCSLDHQIKWQKRNKLKFVCKICKAVFYWSPSRITQTNPTYCSVVCRNKDPEQRRRLLKMTAMQQNLYPNKLERNGYKILKSLKVYFKRQKVVGNKFVVDAYAPKQNTIIQFDGDYWHGNTRKYHILNQIQKRRRIIDKSQNAYFKACGYKVIRIWESQIKNNPSHVRYLLMKKLDLFQADSIP